jgi:hypothetical protein
MDEIPAVPTPPPEIPRGKLWRALLAPSVVTVIGTLIASAAARSNRSYGEELLLMLPIGLVLILLAAIPFSKALGVRYRGRSLVLTTIGFILGQIILCLGLWFGCCLVSLR